MCGAGRGAGHGRERGPAVGLCHAAHGTGGEGAQERPEGRDGGGDEADVDFDVGPDAGGDVDPWFRGVGEGGAYRLRRPCQVGGGR